VRAQPAHTQHLCTKALLKSLLSLQEEATLELSLLDSFYYSYYHMNLISSAPAPPSALSRQRLRTKWATLVEMRPPRAKV